MHVSFVRSVSLDSWSAKQVYAMQIGSNFQIQEYFRRQRISNTDIRVRYQSKAAAVYRATLAEAVDKGWQRQQEPQEGGSGRQRERQRQQRQHHRQKTASLSSSPRKALAATAASSHHHHDAALSVSMSSSWRPRSSSTGGGGGGGSVQAGAGEASLFEVLVEGGQPIGISIQKDLGSGRAKVYRCVFLICFSCHHHLSALP